MLVLTILNSFEVVYEVCRRVVCKIISLDLSPSVSRWIDLEKLASRCGRLGLARKWAVGFEKGLEFLIGKWAC